MRKKKWLAAVILLAMTFSIFAPLVEAAVDSVVTSVEITPENLLLKPDSSEQLTAWVKDQYGEIMDGYEVTWTSNDAGIAMVNDEGLVTAQGLGSTTVTAACYGVEDTCTVTVEGPRPEVIKLNRNKINLQIGSNLTVLADVYDQFDAVMLGQSISWTSDNPSVASVVYDSGLITGVSKGKTTVTASCYGNSEINATCEVNVFDERTNIVIITGTTGFVAPMVEAYHNLTENRDPPYSFGLKVFSPTDLDSAAGIQRVREAVLNADVLLLEMIGANRHEALHSIFETCYETKWQMEEKQPEIFVQRSGEKENGTWATTGFLVNIVDGLDVRVNKDDAEWTRINTYILNSGVSNWERLMLYLAAKYGKGDVETTENLDPVTLPAYFVYHPAADASSSAYEGSGGGDGSGVFTSAEDYYTWYFQRKHYNPDAPWVGIVGYDSFYKNGDMGLYTPTVLALEEKGINTILLLPSSTTRNTAIREYFYRDLDNDGDKEPAIDTLITCLGFQFDRSTGGEAKTLALFKEMNVPVLNPIYTSDLEKWKTDPAGAMGEVYWQVALPEMEGRIEPILMGGTVTLSVDEETGAVVTKKIALPDRIERLAGRAEAWARLHKMENENKKVAILYYNLHGGKDGIGASYLNVPASLTNILQALKTSGYSVDQDNQLSDGAGNLSEDKVFDAMFTKGRNIGGWAPGELEKFAAQEGIIKLNVEEYLECFQTLPEELQKDVEDEWGPAPGGVMVQDGKIIIPGIISGNIFFGPQPMRGWGEDVDKITHSATLPPTHQYLAFYFWLQKEFKANAVIHLGTHGTAEWLPGKSVGLSGEDWPDIVQGDMPNIYPYIVNNPGEGTQAKRRGYAVLIDHLTAAVANTELYGNLLELHNLSHQYEFAVDPANNRPAEEAEKLKEKIIQLVQLEELDQVLGIDMATIPFMDLLNAAHEYLHDLEAELTTLGLHTFGVAPQGDRFDKMVDAIIAYDPDTRKAMEEEIRANLAKTTEEMDMLLLALSAGFIPPGLGKDPVRNPSVMPTGKNIKSFDPRTVPDKVAWEIGKKAADQLLAAYYAEHGKYPESIGAILWAIETMRTEGQSIAMVMRLLGIEPKWASNGNVESYKITPLAELGRPRIDVVITTSGLFRDTFTVVSTILDKAVRELALLNEDENDNYVKKHYAALRDELISSGKSTEEAEFLAASRVFGEAPGSYGVGLAERMSATNSWDTSEDLVDTYLTRMGYIYGTAPDGSQVFGQMEKDLLVSVLKNVEAVVQVRDSIYGALDNDDVAQYLGGLVLAAEWASGKEVDAYIANTRLGLDGLKIQTLSAFVSQELYRGLLNPLFVQEMLKEGYAGSETLAKWIENAFFMDATTGTISNKAWSDLAAIYVYDESVRSQLNPYALQSLIGYALEAARKGMWEASQEDLTQLSDAYIKAMVDYGVVCCHHTCGNIVFNKWLAQYSTLDNNTLKQFEQALAEATQEDVDIVDSEKPSDHKKDFSSKKEEPIVTEELLPVVEPEQIPTEPELLPAKPSAEPVEKQNPQIQLASQQGKPATAGEQETDTRAQAGGLAASVPQAEEPESAAEKTEEASQAKQVTAYEIQEQQKAPVSTGKKAVAAVAILGALTGAGLFLKGYLAKRA